MKTIDIGRRSFGLACGFGWLLGPARAEPAAPPLLLAREMPAGFDPAGWLVSEKYDGVRAVWDGQRLRFRSGAAIAAPAGFVERLPKQPLDGELWLGRGSFDALSAAVRREQPRDDEWRAMRYMVFELPGAPGPFEARAAAIVALAAQAASPQLEAAPQWRVADRAALERKLAEVVRAGGEGLMLHRADAPYATGRSDALLKFKPQQDADAQVIGHLPGQGKHAGRLGALRVQTPEGISFLLGTGFSDAQRASPPPLGTTVTYTYRGLTPKGVPRFASFLRVREGGV